MALSPPDHRRLSADGGNSGCPHHGARQGRSPRSRRRACGSCPPAETPDHRVNAVSRTFRIGLARKRKIPPRGDKYVEGFLRRRRVCSGRGRRGRPPGGTWMSRTIRASAQLDHANTPSETAVPPPKNRAYQEEQRTERRGGRGAAASTSRSCSTRCRRSRRRLFRAHAGQTDRPRGQDGRRLQRDRRREPAHGAAAGAGRQAVGREGKTRQRVKFGRRRAPGARWRPRSTR